MAFVSGKSGTVYISGQDLTAYFSSYSKSGGAAALETTVLGVDDQTFIGGLKSGTIQVDGFFDGSTDAVDEEVAAVFGSTDVVWTLLPPGDSAGNVGFGFLCVNTNYDINAPIDGVVDISATGQSSVGAESVTVLEPKTAVVATGQTAAHNAGASSSNGGSAYIHAFADTALTSIDVDIEDSSTGAFAGEENTIASFSQITATTASERVTWTGTTEQYVRAAWTLVGTSVTIHISYHRA